MSLKTTYHIDFSSCNNWFPHNTCLSQSRNNRRSIATRGFTVAVVEIYTPFHITIGCHDLPCANGISGLLQKSTRGAISIISSIHYSMPTAHSLPIFPDIFFHSHAFVFWCVTYEDEVLPCPWSLVTLNICWASASASASGSWGRCGRSAIYHELQSRWSRAFQAHTKYIT
jgi:hypothetical protein